MEYFQNLFAPFSNFLGKTAETPLAFDPQGLAAICQLFEAETLGDVYRTEFPISVAPLQKPETIARSSRNYIGFAASLSSDGKWRDRRKSGLEPSSKRNISYTFKEAIQIISAHQDTILTACAENDFAPTGWVTEFNGFRNYSFASNLHVDYATLNKLMHLVSERCGTVIVPHKTTHDIIRTSPFAHILDMPVAIGAHKIKSVVGGLRDQLEEAAIETSENTVCCISCFTVHRKPEGSPRILLTATTSYNPAPLLH